MLVVAIASQKGGSGKTTIAGHLGVEAEKSGFGPVALIDTDPQGSLSQWWNARAAGTPKFAKVGVYELPSALAHLKRTGIRLVIIDTPPAISESIAQVIAVADLVILPTRPSPHDLRAVGATVDIAEKYKKPMIFVMNGATARARITAESAIALSQHGTVAPSTLHHRVDFAASMVDGRTVGEVMPKSASAKEISDLWTYIQDRLSRFEQGDMPAHETTTQLGLTPLGAPAEEVDSESESEESNGNGHEHEKAAVHIPPPIRPVVPMALEVMAVPPPEELPYLGPDRRQAKDRREPAPAPPRGPGFFSGQDRRIANPFGRRHSDQG